MNVHFLLILGGLLVSPHIFAQKQIQKSNLWHFVENSQNADNQKVKDIHSNSYLYLSLEGKRLESNLKKALRKQSSKPHHLLLPRPDGTFQAFEIHESQMMHPALAAKYPDIKTYVGHSAENPAVTLRAEWTESGFTALIQGGGKEASVIEPSPENGPSTYRTFFREKHSHEGQWGCHTEAKNNTEKDILAQPNSQRSADGKLRTFRLALACTGEYAQYHGGSKADALSAMAITINRVNGIFERDLGVHLELVENNDELIFLLPSGDPFTNSEGSTMMGENQELCDEVIGSENYDLGHVFSTGGGGIAVVRSVCLAFHKAKGVTGSPYPEGDGFDIDYVAHEMGHQFGANHTQNNPCNRHGATSVEPGSGSTVMSYAGVCAPNVQMTSDGYFHAISIGEISSHLNGEGGSCAATKIENQCPTADAGPDLHIPHSTPFFLTAQATDADENDVLTYTWEQMDNQPTVMPPAAGNQAGPAFRSQAPTTSPVRFFPNIEALRNGNSPTWEVLPNQARELHFALTVRDNHPGGGCTAQDDLTLQVVETSGPFSVTRPTGDENWMSGTTKEIRWDVADTDHAPVNCSAVDILLSLDGGKTWPVVLATATPNDGAHEIAVPHYPTTEGRIMVRSSENVFFNLSTGIISIQESSEFSLSLNSTDAHCFGEKNGVAEAIASGGTGEYQYSWSNGATDKKLTGLAAGAYTVTVASGNQELARTIVVGQPGELKLNLNGSPATQGSNGMVEAEIDGGSGGYQILWENGGTMPQRQHLTAGKYAVTVTDGNGCTVAADIQLDGTPPLPLEHGTLENVGESWQVVELKNNYDHMVVVASIELAGKGTASVVTRIKDAEGNRFEIKLQRAGASEYPFVPAKIHYLVAEEGAYDKSEYGINFEAWRTTTALTSGKGNWQYEAQDFFHEYENPVVLGQVMSFHDYHWSAFWSSRDGKREQAPTSHSFSLGKHAGQDSRNTILPTEEIGYFVFESGSGFINGKRFQAAVGADKIKGLADSDLGHAYALEGFAKAETAIVSAAGMDDEEGYWPIISDHTPTASTLRLYAMEDQCRDTERGHSSEQVAYLVFGEAEVEDADNQGLEENLAARPDPESYILAYPNPAHEQLKLAFYQRETGGPEIVVTDLFGRVRKQFTLLHAEAGLRETGLDLSGLPTGTYLLQVLEGMNIKTVKIVKG